MLKVLIGSIFISLLSQNSYAENCIVSDALKNKNCSAEYFRARNEKELDDYLLNGKFKDGKLLNLEVDFNIKEKEINIATSCDLKFSREKGLFAKQNGICLKGSSVRLEGENKLVADKNAPIDISALNSVILRRSSLETKGDLSISTSNFLPFDGEVLISRESLLKARNIHINSKSNLFINSESKIKADAIVLNGGNCEVSEKNDRNNDDERDQDRSCRKLSPKFIYSGTCTSNPLPTNLKITSTVNANNSQSINFSVSGAPSTSAINWKFDQVFESIDATTKQDFIYPGKHLAQAVVIGSNGYFRKVGQYLNVSPVKFNKGQIAIFQFNGSKNAPKKIQAAIDMVNVTLTKSNQDPELYFTEIASNMVGVKNILIPYFNYQGKFTLNILPVISNPDEFINSQIDVILNNIDASTSTRSDVMQLNSSILKLIDQLKSKLNSLSSTDKLKLATFLQINFLNDLSLVANHNYSKTFNFLDFIMPTATAQSLQFAIDLIGRDNMRALLAAGIAGAGLAIVSATTAALVKLEIIQGFACPLWCKVGIGFAAMAFSYKLIAAEIDETEAIGDAHLPKEGSLFGEVVGTATNNQVTNIRLRGNFIPVDTQPLYVTPLVLQAVNRVNNDNTYITLANNKIDSINSILSLIDITAPIEQISLVQFPQTSGTGLMSASYVTSVKILSPNDGSVSITPFTTSQDILNVTFNSTKSQNVTIRVSYENTDLDIYEDIDMQIRILVPPKAVINYTKSNLQVNFDSTDPKNPNVTGLTYSWNFGDGQSVNTTSKTLSHNYLVAGTYIISLTVTDSFRASDTANTSVTVGGATYTLVIPPTSYTAEFVDFFGDGTNWMHENFIYSTVNNISSGQFYFAPFDAPTDMKIKMTFSLNGSPNDYYYPGQAYFEFVGKNCKVSPNATVSYSPDQDLYYWNGIINGPGPVTITVECDSINFGLLGYNGIDFSIPPTITFEHMKNSL